MEEAEGKGREGGAARLDDSEKGDRRAAGLPAPWPAPWPPARRALGLKFRGLPPPPPAAGGEPGRKRWTRCGRGLKVTDLAAKALFPAEASLTGRGEPMPAMDAVLVLPAGAALVGEAPPAAAMGPEFSSAAAAAAAAAATGGATAAMAVMADESSLGAVPFLPPSLLRDGARGRCEEKRGQIPPGGDGQGGEGIAGWGIRAFDGVDMVRFSLPRSMGGG